MVNRDVLTRVDPLKNPGAKTSLLSGPNGSHPGGTSLLMKKEVNPRPPIPVKAGSNISLVIFLAFISTLTIFIPPPHFFIIVLIIALLYENLCKPG
jgi:hypothetical protein